MRQPASTSTDADRAQLDGVRSTPPPRPEDLTASQRARRERIVAQALEALTRLDYDEIQVRDVAAAADVALGTLYRYFTSKEHLFAAVLVKWGDALRSRFERSPLERSDPAGQLTEIYGRAIDGFARWPQFFRMLVVIEASTDPHAKALYAEFSARTQDAFASPIQGFAPRDAEAISLTLLAVLNTALRQWANGELAIADVRARMSAAIELIFSPPPQRL
jgi:TetR/AcrR family transcriptional regulator, cholesterol catabolism regulator